MGWLARLADGAAAAAAGPGSHWLILLISFGKVR